MPRLAVIGVCALAVLLAGAGYAFFKEGSSQSYLTAPVERGNVATVVKSTGTVNPVLTITVGTYVSGIIQEVHCDYNTEVNQGQLCAKLAPRAYQRVVNQNTAT